MNFQSLHFLLFLFGLVVACGLLWRNFAVRKNLLLLTSYYFYMSWDWRFGGLLAVTTLVHFAVGRKLAGEQREGWRRAWLALSVLAGLGVLAYFKYANFFIQSAVVLLKVDRAARPQGLQEVLADAVGVRVLGRLVVAAESVREARRGGSGHR